MSDANDVIIIKRYASRRLYNTSTSEYVTLDEIAGLIRGGSDVQIVDSKSGDDLTRQFLLQIITKQETGSESILPLDVLKDVVRSYSDKAGSVVPDFLSRSFEMLKSQQEEMLTSIKRHVPESINPLEIFNLDSWQKAQSELLNTTLSSWGFGNDDDNSDASEPPKDAKPAKTSSDEDEIALMKKQLAEMQEKLKNL